MKHVCAAVIALSWAAAPAGAYEVSEASAAAPLSVAQTFTIYSGALREVRRINVYQPPVYEQSSDMRLPVLYMPDGGLDENFLHIAGLVQVSVASGTMRPFLLVGIESAQQNRDLIGSTNVAEYKKIAPQGGGSAALRRFIRLELMPVIRARYRTMDETAIIGESVAGSFAVETFFLEPDLFDTCIAFDPSFSWREYLIEHAASRRVTGPSGGRTLYLASSRDEELAAPTRKLAAILEKQAPAALRWHHEPMPQETHATIYHPAALAALRRLFAP